MNNKKIDMKSIRIFFMIALAVGLFAGCKPEITGELEIGRAHV